MLSWLPAIILAAGGFLLGLVVDRLLVGRLRRYAATTENLFFLQLATIIGRAPLILSITGGLYLARFNVPYDLPANVGHLVDVGLFNLAAITVTLVSARIAVAAVTLYTARVEGVIPSTSIFTNIVRLAVIILGGLIILQSLGISITPLLTALGVGGLAVALALQDTMSNLFAGLQILASRQLRPGDYIKLGNGEEGYVQDISWRVTTVQAMGLQTHVIPNSKIASAIVTNFNLPESVLGILVPVGVSYDSDLEKVETVTLEVAREILQEVEGGVSEYEPVVRYNNFADSAITFNVVLRTTAFGSQYVLKHEFIKRLHRRYNEEKIEIPFPQRVVHLREVRG